MVSPASPGAGHGWRWIPTLYFAEGLPYVLAMTVSVVMYKNLGVSNTEIALYTSWLYLPWVIKPLWSPVVDLWGTKRGWVVRLQFLIGVSLALIGLSVPTSHVVQLTLCVFWLMAFSSATHDIAADGFYLLALPQHQQAAFVGVRSTFYRLAMIAGQGGLVYLAGSLQSRLGDVPRAWSVIFFGMAVMFVGWAAYHAWALPRPLNDHADPGQRGFWVRFAGVFAEFFRRKDLAVVLCVLLLYRLAEAQLLKLVTPFLLDRREVGGLGLTTQQVGIVYGTVGVVALLLGGIVGGLAIARFGLKRMLWPMLITMHVPNVVFVVLAYTQPQNLALLGGALAIEQFGYGFGFSAYMLYMILVSEGAHKTAHYAICTGIMALGMMLPGMVAGWIQEHLGYRHFFVYVCAATIPSFFAVGRLRIDPAFGRSAR